MATKTVVPISSSSVATSTTLPTRIIGLDIHKRYLVAAGVECTRKQVVYGPKRVESGNISAWVARDLHASDAVVLEMTTHTWQMVDLLTPYVSSVTVVHPPHVHLITRARVMNDQRAAVILAQLHAANLLPPVWVPPPEVRDQRALVAQRRKMVKLGAIAKNRLQSLLHRFQIAPPPDLDLYSEAARTWWLSLPVSSLERFRLGSDLDTLSFANRQIKSLDDCLGALAVDDPRMPLLVQIPGLGGKLGMMVLAAIGDITRFPHAKNLVGYAGLGARVHDSGDHQWSGRITKQGRRDLRYAMVQAANNAVDHPKWRKELARLEPRIGRSKAIVAIARKLLVVVWHVLTKEVTDRQVPVDVAKSFFRHARSIGLPLINRLLHGEISSSPNYFLAREFKSITTFSQSSW